jgi:hypothetical protein
MSETPNETFVPLHVAAARLGVPTAWLRTEAEAGRISSLRAGRRLLINPRMVEAELLLRTQQQQASEEQNVSAH